MLPADVDSPVYSHFIRKSTRTFYLPWTEFFFAIFTALLGVIELVAYKETICGYLLLFYGLVMFNLFILFNYGNWYNSAVLLRTHTALAGFLALVMFIFTAFSLLYIDTDKSMKYSFRNTARIIWASLFCFMALLVAFAVGSNSRANEIESMETARQEFFKKIMLTTQQYFNSAPEIPEINKKD